MSKEATLQMDPDVKVPAAVRAAAARSDALVKAMRGEAPADTQADAPQEVTSEGNPELQAQSLTADNQQTQPVQQAQEQPKPAPEAADDDGTWEHKYKSMHGRYTRSQEQVRQLAEQVANLQGIIATMQATAPTTPAPELSVERLITDEEAADYGQDFLNVVGKKAKEELSPLVKAAYQRIDELEKKVQGVTGLQVQSSTEKLHATLDEKLPNWREMNTNEEFLSWLSLPDPYSGDIRHNMLKQAYAQGDARRVLNFFNGFLAEEAAVAPAGGQPDLTTERVAKVPLEKLAAPGRAKTAASAPAPAEKPIITRAQIQQFYSDIAANKYRGRDAEKLRLESMIFEAQREGRIR